MTPIMIYKKVRARSEALVQIYKITKEESYYPDKERKSSSRVFLENLLWVKKNKCINYSYNQNGLDIKNWRNSDNFLPTRPFESERDFGNLCKNEGFDYNYLALLKDKYVFSSYLSHVIGEDKVVPTIALYNNEEVYLLTEKIYISFEEFLKKDMKVFCKTTDGLRGEGIFIIEKKKGNYYLNNKKTTLLEIKKEIKDSKFIFQNVIQQHDFLNNINNSSVNSIRIITVKGTSGKVNILSSFLRLGATRDSFVDNVSTGGLAVGVDDNGILKKYGFYDKSFGTKVKKHPISNVVFEGCQLPYWKEIKDLVEKAHKQFYYVQFIGWDVAITPNGPILIEGNDQWGTDTAQSIEGGLKEKWYKLKNS